MGPGQVNIMAPGEDVEFANPTHPNGSFDKFAAAISAQVGAALEGAASRLVRIRCLPFELLVLSLELLDVCVPLAAVEADRALLMR